MSRYNKNVRNPCPQLSHNMSALLRPNYIQQYYLAWQGLPRPHQPPNLWENLYMFVITATEPVAAAWRHACDYKLWPTQFSASIMVTSNNVSSHKALWSCQISVNKYHERTDMCKWWISVGGMMPASELRAQRAARVAVHSIHHQPKNTFSISGLKSVTKQGHRWRRQP